jgi:peptide/nickel transport system substrate-binding protein
MLNKPVLRSILTGSHAAAARWRNRVVVPGVVISALVLAACGGSSSPTKAASSGSGTTAASGSATSGSGSTTSGSGGTPTTGGTLTVDMSNIPICVDPEVSPQYQTYEFSRNVVDSLVAQNGTGYNFVPWLATSWTISPDAEHYTFQLRQGVVFSDGTPFNAAAVKYNFDRVINPATKSYTPAELLGPYKSTTVLGPYSVEVNFSQPYATFLQGLGMPWLGIESPTYLSSKSYQPCSPPVGTGPYEASSYTPDEQVTLVPNPHYGDWAPSIYTHKGPGYLSKIVFNFVTNDATRVGALTSGQAQLIEDTPINQVSAVESQGIKLIRQNQAGISFQLGLNVAKAPSTDPLVREAFRDIIDAKGIVNGLLQGEYTQAWAPLSPATLDYDPAFVDTWKQDVPEANKLLDQDGYTQRNSSGIREKNGQPLNLVYLDADPRQDRPEIALLIKQEAAAAGIGITLVQNMAQETADLADGQYNMVEEQYVRDDPDMLRLFYDGQYDADKHAGAADNGSNLDNPQVNTWLQNAAGTLDQATRKTLYDNVQSYLINNYITTPIYNLGSLYGSSSKLHGYSLDSEGWIQLYDAYLSK